ncbi:MAG TPA: hypothetical protein VF929_02925 [Gemmatimonadaceae bacterium]
MNARLFGLRLRVPDSLALLLPISPDAGHDIDILLIDRPPDAAEGERHYATGACLDESEGLRVLRKADDTFEFWFGDGTWARINGDATQIDAFTPASSTDEDTLSYLTGPVLGFALSMRGVLALHASAVVLDGVAIAFAGPSGAGKSTTAALLSLAGARVLTEDLLALTGVEDGVQIAAHPGFASIRLWSDGASLLGLSSLSRVTANWNKLELPVAPAPEGVPLGLVYLLDVDASACAESVSAPLTNATVLLELVASTYVSRLLRRTDSGRTLVRLGSLASRVPVRRLTIARPPDVNALRALLERDLHDARKPW